MSQPLASASGPTPAEQAFARYHAGWEARDPDQIVSRHSPESTFRLHDGSDPVTGRPALRAHFAHLLTSLDFRFDSHRVLYGERHWVYEWTMVVDLVDTDGQPFTARVDMVDVVDFDDAGEVTRKDTYVDDTQRRAAFARAGAGSDPLRD
jgi:hypothetical protein